MWPTLVDHARLFAVDLPGFGASERRDDLLSPRAMGEFLARLIAETDLGRPHVVGPDVGTSAVLSVAAADPELMASATVGSGGAAVPLELGEPLASRVLDPDVEKWRAYATLAGLSVQLSTPSRAAYPTTFELTTWFATRATATSVDALRAHVSGGAACASRSVAANRDAGHDHQRRQRPRRPVANREFLDERLPNSRVAIIDAGHFVCEEAPAEYASHILRSHSGEQRMSVTP